MRSLWFLLCSALPTLALANPIDTFGAGARAQGLAGGVTTLASDYTAVWHNPAALSQSDGEAGLGLIYTFDRTSILLSPRPQGYDPPAYGLRLQRRADTDKENEAFGVLLGVTLPLMKNLRAGVLLYIPSVGLAHADSSYADEREQYFSHQLHFTRLGENLRSDTIATAVSYRLAEWLSVGLGLNIMTVSYSDNYTYTPNAADPGATFINSTIEQQSSTALMLGVLAEPLAGLRLAMTFHDENAFRLKLHNQVQVAGQEGDEGHPFEQELEIVQHALPVRLTLGASYGDEGLVGTVEARYEAHERWQDGHARRAGFNDVVSVKGGVEYQVREGTFVRAGLGWHPSPVPDQTGRTNYVDNDRVVGALGFGEMFQLFGQQFDLDVALQLHGLLTRSVRKSAAYAPDCAAAKNVCDELPDRETDGPVYTAAETEGLQTGNPGFPGFSSGGYLLVFGADLQWRF